MYFAHFCYIFADLYDIPEVAAMFNCLYFVLNV